MPIHDHNGDGVGVQITAENMLKTHMKRFIELQKLKGANMPPGIYSLDLKVLYFNTLRSINSLFLQTGFDASKHNSYQFKGGSKRDKRNPLTEYVQ